jgi:hypothetical protein
MVLMRVLTTAVAALLIGACTTSSAGRASGAPQDNNQPIEQRLAGDFPIPTGVKVDLGESLVLGSGASWTGRIVFGTDSTPNDTFVFYREQPKSAGWVLVASLFSKASVLTFTKGNRSATIQITSSTFGSTQVSITVGALSGN